MILNTYEAIASHDAICDLQTRPKGSKIKVWQQTYKQHHNKHDTPDCKCTLSLFSHIL